MGLRTAGLCLLVEGYYYTHPMGTNLIYFVGACYSSPTLDPFHLLLVEKFMLTKA